MDHVRCLKETHLASAYAVVLTFSIYLLLSIIAMDLYQREAVRGPCVAVSGPTSSSISAATAASSHSQPRAGGIRAPQAGVQVVSSLGQVLHPPPPLSTPFMTGQPLANPMNAYAHTALPVSSASATVNEQRNASIQRMNATQNTSRMSRSQASRATPAPEVSLSPSSPATTASTSTTQAKLRIVLWVFKHLDFLPTD
ncbi:hypothetical protein NP233_g12263 [Leucocoprinus birnbaumii]|uniref:Uncharacterized protein n=1 Tax=Leucocoprinus birnbaumii TaxID=56174 RepID=A0AAD5VEZ5_9AGAR|nr:hypothetical protein NP233_g12263 [Leucocoprinus birnbaumii]